MDKGFCTAHYYSMHCENFIRQYTNIVNLQSFTKCLRGTLVSMSYTVLQEKFNFYFSGDFGSSFVERFGAGLKVKQVFRFSGFFLILYDPKF